MKKLLFFIKKINLLFSLFILSLFYIFILPISKIIFLISEVFETKHVNTYWQEQEKRKLDLESSY